ncbi:TolC family protein [Algibacillus agarilyticus]|uniref:TolC family protein n=1 Tax=Algibacillus agarilyticus TaxID=2234133 RepID=UPI000DD01350|nr:TolC family protein [Algibacillus agarilyticus]
MYLYTLKNALWRLFNHTILLNVQRIILIFFCGYHTVYASQIELQVNGISLTEAIKQAQQNDVWLQGNHLTQQAILAKSISERTLADPTVSLGFLNIPTDNLALNQDGMSQIKLGISQQFPRGDALAIKQQALKIEASQYPLMRADRLAKIETQVTQIWLDAYLAQQTLSLIKQDKALFVQMVDIAKATYASTAGKTRQHDVIRAQLELIQLDDRITIQSQKRATALAQLQKWLPTTRLNSIKADISSIGNERPRLVLTGARWLKGFTYKPHLIAQQLNKHPLMKIIDAKQDIAHQATALAKTQYQPQWGVNASYAYRVDTQNSPMGSQDRPDLFSIGISFDVPLFTSNKQDKAVEGSILRAEAVRTEKDLRLNDMMSEIAQELAQLKHLSKRQALYNQQLLTQMHEQAETSLTAYTHDDGRFSDVVSARIAELNAQIAALKIDIDALKTIARLNYFFIAPGNDEMHKLGIN